MKTLSGVLFLSLVLNSLARAGQPLPPQGLPEPLAEYFFAPELVRLAYPALDLTEEQKAVLQAADAKVAERQAQLRQTLEQETGKLVALAKAEPLEGDAIMAQADKVLKLEVESKRAQLALLLKIRETLTPEQQSKLKEFKAKSARFQAGIRQAMELAQKWKEQGRDLSQFEQARGEFERLMGEGNFQAAEVLLNRTLKRLQTPAPEPKK